MKHMASKTDSHIAGDNFIQSYTLIYKNFPCITSHAFLLILNRHNFLNMFNRLSAEQKENCITIQISEVLE